MPISAVGNPIEIIAPQIIAHRGARTLADYNAIAPENTLPAFDAAASLGAAIELDVIATRDGEVIVHHDDDTGRLFQLPGKPQALRHLSYTQVQQAQFTPAQHNADVQKLLDDAHKRYQLSPQFAETKIPKLSEVLTRYPNTHLYIELKTDNDQVSQNDNNNLEQRVADLITQHNALGRVTVISFSTKSLQRIKTINPAISTGLDINIPDYVKRIPLANKLLASYVKHVLKADVLLPSYTGTTPKLVNAAHKRGLKITPWVNQQTRPQETPWFEKLMTMGVDGIITNAPDALKTFLEG